MADMTCTICLQPFGASVDADPRQWFPCSHSVHQPCAMEFSRVLGAPLDELACPVCRLVPDDAQNLVGTIPVDGGALAGTMHVDTIVVNDDADTQELPDRQPDLDEEVSVHPSAEALAVIAGDGHIAAALNEQDEEQEEAGEV